MAHKNFLKFDTPIRNILYRRIIKIQVNLSVVNCFLLGMIEV